MWRYFSDCLPQAGPRLDLLDLAELETFAQPDPASQLGPDRAGLNQWLETISPIARYVFSFTAPFVKMNIENYLQIVNFSIDSVYLDSFQCSKCNIQDRCNMYID